MKKALLFVLLVCVVLCLLFTTIVAHTTHEHEIEAKEVKSFAYCCIHKTAPYTEIPGVVAQIWPVFQQQGIMPTGPMLGVYLNSPHEVKPEELEWEIGFPVSAEATPQPPLVKKTWEFTHVAVYTFTGPYEKTAEAYPKIMEWMEKHGYTGNGPIMERYMTDPMMETDTTKYQTEIWIPVAKK